jgi:hypothetical protein
MKIFNFRNHFIVSLALSLLMLSACSSTEESSEPGDTSTDSGDRDCSQFTNDVDVRECEMWNELH